MLCARSIQACPTLWGPPTAAQQAPLSRGFSRQEYGSRLPCPPPGNRPHPGTELPSLYSSCADRRVLHLQRHVGSPSSLGYAVKALACGKPVVPGLRSEAPCLSVSHTVMCLCQSHNPVILIYPPLASPVATISWFSLSASLFLFDKQVHLYYSLDS